MTRESLVTQDWEGIVARLGGAAALEQSARDTKAFLRARAIATAVDLLRLILAYCLGERGLARDAYCETIFTERLYGRLSAAAQRMLSQAAVFGLAVTVDGLAAVAGVAAPAVREAAAQWRGSALAHMNTGSGRDLCSVYGMLRG
jgi:hypothetical protein